MARINKFADEQRKRNSENAEYIAPKTDEEIIIETGASEVLSENVNIAELVPNIHNMRNTRRDAEYNKLVSSIKEFGLLNAIIVTEIDGQLRIISGHRRRLACLEAGLKTVPVKRVKFDTEEKAIKALIDEEATKRITNIMDLARTIEDYREVVRQNRPKDNPFIERRFRDEMCKTLGISTGYYNNLNKLLRLNTDTRNLIEVGFIDKMDSYQLSNMVGTGEDYDPEIEQILCKEAGKTISSIYEQAGIKAEECSLNELCDLIYTITDDFYSEEEIKAMENKSAPSDEKSRQDKVRKSIQKSMKTIITNIKSNQEKKSSGGRPSNTKVKKFTENIQKDIEKAISDIESNSYSLKNSEKQNCIDSLNNSIEMINKIIDLIS